MVSVKRYTYSFSGIFAAVAVSNMWTGVRAQDDGSGKKKKRRSFLLFWFLFIDSELNILR